MFKVLFYPRMELSGLHCDFAALGSFHRQRKHVDFDKAVNSGFFPDRQAVFPDHLTYITGLVTSTTAELIQRDVRLRNHEIDAWPH